MNVFLLLITYSIAIVVIVILATAHIKILNRNHSARRVSLGKPAEVVDSSMEAEHTLKEKGQALNAEDGGLGEKAFYDMTDLENEDFIFVY